MSWHTTIFFYGTIIFFYYLCKTKATFFHAPQKKHKSALFNSNKKS